MPRIDPSLPFVAPVWVHALVNMWKLCALPPWPFTLYFKKSGETSLAVNGETLQFKGSLVEGPPARDSQHVSAGFERGENRGKQAAPPLPVELECA